MEFTYEVNLIVRPAAFNINILESTIDSLRRRRQRRKKKTTKCDRNADTVLAKFEKWNPPP